ncbi:recombinase family protein [Longicatena caecimuris]|uniref:recombinase family protein n=1 Tax=Longicatena caecimuris TaxID=1796635 RepID=UPI0022E0B5BC|nr:recombinase family protein [Longicatena caecimuris]
MCAYSVFNTFPVYPLSAKPLILLAFCRYRYHTSLFNRPDFQNMIKDIEDGKINCVITKDLSRLGRNYLDCGLYLEVFFPEHNVRYISVNDGVDTLSKTAMDITPFRNILNEMYSADVSVKIKSAYRARFNEGKFMGTTAPYGYMKDPTDHNHLIIDSRVAPVVRKIFDMALEGNGIRIIRNYLRENRILRPAAYAASIGASGYERYFEDNEENRYLWSENGVRQILRSAVYAGNLVGYKRIAVNMKSKKRPSKLPEDWEVIPNTHEGIVTQQEFDTVQSLMTSRRRTKGTSGFDNIFAGIIKCADCGYAMRAASANRRKRPDIIDCVQYTCNNYGSYGNVACTSHTIEARDLFNAVLADINFYANLSLDDSKAVKELQRRLNTIGTTETKSLEREKRKLSKRLAELDKLFSKLYEDRVLENITERNYDMVSKKYEAEQEEIEKRLAEVDTVLSRKEQSENGVVDFLAKIREYRGITKLNARVVNELIDKITISERVVSSDGVKEQVITIYYKFVEGNLNELHIVPTKRWTELAPRHCAVCGKEYMPLSAVAKYCPACREKVRKEQSNESTRRRRAEKKIAG